MLDTSLSTSMTEGRGKRLRTSMRRYAIPVSPGYKYEDRLLRASVSCRSTRDCKLAGHLADVLYDAASVYRSKGPTHIVHSSAYESIRR